jgi:hypothetical protein
MLRRLSWVCALLALPALAQNSAESPLFRLNTWWQSSAPNESGLFTLYTLGAAPTFSSVGGIVTNAMDGQPISGAAIQILPLELAGSATSDVAGAWSRVLQGGSGYRLLAEADGYQPLWLYNLAFPSGQSIQLDLELDPIDAVYSAFRLVELAQAPNPDPLPVPEGGFGYAWFVVEGEAAPGVWLPVPGARVEVEDAQGQSWENVANRLPYAFLTTLVHLEHAGAVGLRIPADEIGDGSPGASETITVMAVNGLPLEPAARIELQADVEAYRYSADWGYRIYGKGGVGATAGVATATGFAGGGSGATVALDLEGLGTDPTWSRFRILRRTDLFVGVEAKLGPPQLVEVAVVPKAEVTASFPYQEEYEFDLAQLEGLEPALAFYLLLEPSILFAGATSPLTQPTVNFLSWLVEALFLNGGAEGVGVARIADESGLDVEGSVRLGVSGLEFPAALHLGMTPGIGANAHIGGSLRRGVDGWTTRRLGVGAGYSAGLGLKLLPADGVEVKGFYPFQLASRPLPSSLQVDFELLGG